MRKFYSNVGNKIKILAQFGAILGIIVVIAGIVVSIGESPEAGIALAVSGLFLILGSLPMYAFGQITEDVREIRNSTNGSSCKIDNDLPQL